MCVCLICAAGVFQTQWVSLDVKKAFLSPEKVKLRQLNMSSAESVDAAVASSENVTQTQSKQAVGKVISILSEPCQRETVVCLRGSVCLYFFFELVVDLN